MRGWREQHGIVIATKPIIPLSTVQSIPPVIPVESRQDYESHSNNDTSIAHTWEDHKQNTALSHFLSHFYLFLNPWESFLQNNQNCKRSSPGCLPIFKNSAPPSNLNTYKSLERSPIRMDCNACSIQVLPPHVTLTFCKNLSQQQTFQKYWIRHGSMSSFWVQKLHFQVWSEHWVIYAEYYILNSKWNTVRMFNFSLNVLYFISTMPSFDLLKEIKKTWKLF